MASVEFWGPKFSPSKIEKEISFRFSEKTEFGELGKSGKYKNKPVPFGSASLIPPKKVKSDNRILWLADRLKNDIKKIKKAGAKFIKFWIGYCYYEQCNCLLTVKELKALSSLEIPFVFSSYSIENQEEFNKFE